MIKKIVNLANYLDKAGHANAANLLDALLHKLAADESGESGDNDVGRILDISKKIEERKQKGEQEKERLSALDKLNEATPPTEIEQGPAPLDVFTQKKLQRAEGIWQHRFSNVRKDSSGFFILKEDNDAGNLMQPGDKLADVAMNLTPYWVITTISGNKINLNPIPPNPFATGVGAGGAKITDSDISVFTGDYERARVTKIRDLMNSGKATIDDIKYLLLGTVPVNMGPNGSQGGWYNPDDSYSNRGGRKGMRPEEIVVADAKRLKELGFPVPVKALNGEMSPYVWTQWVDGNGSPSGQYIPRNIEKYVDFHKKMTDKGRWRYDEAAIESLRSRFTKDKINKEWTEVLEDFLKMSEAEFKQKHKYYEYSLDYITKAHKEALDRFDKHVEEYNAFAVEGEDDSIESLLRSAFNPERRVAIRAVYKLLELCKEDESYIKYLHDIVRVGGTDWLANEAILKFFDITDDIDGLKLGVEKLSPSDNKRYALNYLLHKGEKEYVSKYLDSNIDDLDFEVLKAVTSNFRKDKNSLFERDQGILDFAKKYNFYERIVNTLNDKSNPNRWMALYHSQDLIGLILRSFGSKLDWMPGDEENIDKLNDLYEQVKEELNKK